jgi:PKD repeat protein
MDIVVSASPSTADAGNDQVICATAGAATMAGNTPATGTGAWSQIAGPVSATINNAASPSTPITGMTTAGTYTFRWTISNGSCAVSTDDVDIISGGCTYYSQATGDVTDDIWSLQPVGTPGFASFNSGISMVVQSGHVVTNTAVTAVRNVTVDAGGELVLGNSTSLQVNGNATFNGTLTADISSELEMAGSTASTLSVSGSPIFYNLTANNAAGITVGGTGTVQIRGTLLLQDGNFDCTGHPVTLRSTATYTGRLGPVAAAATYTGNLRIERYIPAGATNWRLIGSPIQNRKVVHLQDDFYTAGYPGSQYPNFFDPPTSGIFWPSIRWYDETNTGSGQNDGMLGVSSHNQNLSTGQGFAAWCGTGLTTTTAFKMDLENQPPVIASTPIGLPMSYTNTGNAAVDGWNLVSNPLPSPIAFDQIVRGADVADYVTYFDPTTGNMASYDISSGISQNGGTNVIQSMQGFFLKATGADATATVDESAKVASNSGGFFGGTEEGPAALRLHLASTINSFSDETVVVFSEGSPTVDGDDVPKYVFAHPQAPQIASMGPAGELMAMNAFGPYTTDITIPVMVDVAVTGTYTVSVTGIETLGLSCLRIEDLLTNAVTVLAEGATYSFDVEASADASEPRLLIHASAPIAINVTMPACHGDANGGAEVMLTSSNADVTWLNDQGDVIGTTADATGAVSLNGLAAGDYQINVDGYLGCGLMAASFQIGQPEVLILDGSATDATCPNSADGEVMLTVSGGTAPYAYAWSNGSSDESLSAGPGDYTVQVTDANGCQVDSETWSIGSGVGPTAAASADAFTVMVGVPVAFINNSVGATSQTWDFGDGSTSTEAAPSYAYAAPGTYTVILTVDDGSCTSTTTLEITVELSTGLAQASEQLSMRAWLNGDHLVVEHQFGDKYPVQLELLNEAGQVHQQMRVAGPAGRMTVPADDLASGIWYVRVSNAEVIKTLPVVIVR